MTASFRFDSVKWGTLDDLDQLAHLSRFYGSDPEFVLAGGGNTSVKVDGTLHVKASGESLATIDRNGFVAMDLERTLQVLTKKYSTRPFQREAEVKADLLGARLDPTTPLRPSVEAVLHAQIEQKFVVHTHPAMVNGLTCSRRGRERVRKLFGDRAVWVDYTDPGYRLSKQLADAIAKHRKRTGNAPQIFLFGNHGLCVAANDVHAVHRLTQQVFLTLSRAGVGKRWTSFTSRARPVDADVERPLVDRLAPMLRGLLAQEGRRPIVRFDNSDAMRALAGSAVGRKLAATGPVYPDQIVNCRSWAMWVPAKKDQDTGAVARSVTRTLNAYRKKHKLDPTVILVEGLGLFSVGVHARAAADSAAVYLDIIRVMVETGAFGGTRPFTQRERTFIETWEAETYRIQVAAQGSGEGRMARRVALVTGGAQGIGDGIASGLAAEGAHVVIADMNLDGARARSQALDDEHGPGRTVAVEANVTDETSVADMVHQAVRAYGGVDLLVSNAGVLKAGSVKALDKADFEFVTDVNYVGYFLCVKHVAPVMAAQHAANPELTSDIVQVNSKSGLEGSNRNAAYAGGKFGGIGLTQSFAMELVEDGIKVNSVCPGNYLDGPLWSDPKKGLFVQYLKGGKVPGARTVKEVRKAYEAKVPMGRGLDIADLVRAICYLVEQQYETGQALPVTGGQVMLS